MVRDVERRSAPFSIGLTLLASVYRGRSERMISTNRSVLAVAFRNRDLCARTGTCVGICPENAISLDNNYYPVLDESACTECGKCGAVCPGGHVNFEELSQQSFDVGDDGSFDGYFKQILVGYAVDKLVHKKGTGGGVITALAIMLLETGAVDCFVLTQLKG